MTSTTKTPTLFVLVSESQPIFICMHRRRIERTQQPFIDSFVYKPKLHYVQITYSEPFFPRLKTTRLWTRRLLCSIPDGFFWVLRWFEKFLFPIVIFVSFVDFTLICSNMFFCKWKSFCDAENLIFEIFSVESLGVSFSILNIRFYRLHNTYIGLKFIFKRYFYFVIAFQISRNVSKSIKLIGIDKSIPPLLLLPLSPCRIIIGI